MNDTGDEWRITACLRPRRRAALAAEIGADGRRLLGAIDAAADRPELMRLPKVEVLRRVWAAQYAEEEGRLRWRVSDELPPCAE